MLTSAPMSTKKRIPEVLSMIRLLDILGRVLLSCDYNYVDTMTNRLVIDPK